MRERRPVRHWSRRIPWIEETIHVPRGVVHSGANVGQQPGCRIVLFSPSGMERFFLEVGALTKDVEIDLAAAVASATQHGWEFVARS